MPSSLSANTSIAPGFADALLPAPVLVVEDEPLFRQRLQDVLLQLGYASEALVFAATLAEARACLAVQPVALALVDLMLPDGHGRSLIESLRAQDPGIGILVVTAWSSEDDILGALHAGATGYVLKERDDFEVMLSIRSALRGHHGPLGLQHAYLPEVEAVDSNHPIKELYSKVLSSPCPLPIVDEQGRYKGSISKNTLLRFLDPDTDIHGNPLPETAEADVAADTATAQA